MNGQIVRVIASRGFAFARAEGISEDIFFVHATECRFDFATLREGQRIAFDAGISKKGGGTRALNVAFI